MGNAKNGKFKWHILGLFIHYEQIFWKQLSISSLKNQVLVIKCFRKKNWDFSKMMERESHLDFISLFGLNLDFSIPIRDVEKMVEGARTSRLWVKSTLGRRGFSSRAKIIWPSAFSLSIIRSGLGAQLKDEEVKSEIHLRKMSSVMTCNTVREITTPIPIWYLLLRALYWSKWQREDEGKQSNWKCA